MKFRQKPVVIDAERFDPENSELPFKGSGNPCCYVLGIEPLGFNHHGPLAELHWLVSSC